MKNFIIIEHEPLTSRLEEIWSLRELAGKNVSVKYWDLSQLIYKGINIPNIIDSSVEVLCFTSIISLKKELENLDIENTVFALEIFINWHNREIIQLLKKNKCKCVKIDLYANTGLPISMKNRLLNSTLSLNPKGLLNSLFNYIYRNIFISHPYELTLSSSHSSADILINHPDYENYLYGDCSSKPETYPYILFIDTFYPLHPDLKYYFKLKIEEKDVREYRDLMMRFFDFLEYKYKKKVVVAAHPKSLYIGNEFGNRSILKGYTSSLIKYADMIVTHESNSLSYIALSNKPFIFVYPESYTNRLRQYMFALSNYCRKKTYNLNKFDWDKIVFSPLDDKVRENYIGNFIASSQSSEKRNVDIIIDNLLKN